jgi:hypothetical protein
MQAIGMVNDHVVDCFRYREILREFAHAKEAAQLFDGESRRKWRTR